MLEQRIAALERQNRFFRVLLLVGMCGALAAAAGAAQKKAPAEIRAKARDLTIVDANGETIAYIGEADGEAGTCQLRLKGKGSTVSFRLTDGRVHTSQSAGQSGITTIVGEYALLEAVCGPADGKRVSVGAWPETVKVIAGDDETGASLLMSPGEAGFVAKAEKATRAVLAWTKNSGGMVSINNDVGKSVWATHEKRK
jgi:hypothetical protein